MVKHIQTIRRRIVWVFLTILWGWKIKMKVENQTLILIKEIHQERKSLVIQR